MDKNREIKMKSYIFQDYITEDLPLRKRILLITRALFSINKVGKINMWVRANIRLSSSRIRIFQLLARYCHNHILKWYSSEISPYSKIGKHISFPHPIGIVIGNGVTIGDNVTIYQNTTIGKKCDSDFEYPKIGNNVVIFTGATIIGNIQIADDCIIGAHAIVTQSTEAGHTYAGIPAKIIR